MSYRTQSNVCFQFAEKGTCRYGSACRFSHDKARTARPGKSSKSRTPGGARHPKKDSLDKFFAKYVEFDYDSKQPIWDEFYRMCDLFDWDIEDFEMREAQRNFKSAMVQQFNKLYGNDEEDLESWQRLCRILKIQNSPQEAKACRKLVRQTHVNLVDLVDTPRTGEPVKVFHSLKQLQEYTIKTGKFFPKKDAYAGGLLRYLLREILR